MVDGNCACLTVRRIIAEFLLTKKTAMSEIYSISENICPKSVNIDDSILFLYLNVIKDYPLTQNATISQWYLLGKDHYN